MTGLKPTRHPVSCVDNSFIHLFIHSAVQSIKGLVNQNANANPPRGLRVGLETDVAGYIAVLRFS